MMDVVDGWFVSRYYEAEDFAIFRYGARELPFSSVLYNSISVAMIPFIVSGESFIITVEIKSNKMDACVISSLHCDDVYKSCIIYIDL
jgi:hypothetical protein